MPRASGLPLRQRQRAGPVAVCLATHLVGRDGSSAPAGSEGALTFRCRRLLPYGLALVVTSYPGFVVCGAAALDSQEKR